MTAEKTVKDLQQILKEIQKYNLIKNDLDAYLFELVEFALGRRIDRPEPEDYGIEE